MRACNCKKISCPNVFLISFYTVAEINCYCLVSKSSTVSSYNCECLKHALNQNLCQNLNILFRCVEVGGIKFVENVAFGIYPTNPFYLVLNVQSTYKRTDKSISKHCILKKTFLCK